MTDERTHYVYEAYDADGICLYVGCTGNLHQRLSSHLRPSYDARGWFGPFHDVWRVSGPYAKETALQIESERINKYQPIFNGQSRKNRGGERCLIQDYLRHHKVQFAPHPRYANSAVLVSRRGRPRLRVAS